MVVRQCHFWTDRLYPLISLLISCLSISGVWVGWHLPPNESYQQFSGSGSAAWSRPLEKAERIFKAMIGGIDVVWDSVGIIKSRVLMVHLRPFNEAEAEAAAFFIPHTRQNALDFW